MPYSRAPGRDSTMRPPADGLVPGDHACCLFNSDEEHDAALACFVEEGLQRRERVVYLSDGSGPPVHERLIRAGLDGVERRVASGQIRSVDRRAWFGVDDLLDWRVAATRLGQDRELALASGFEGLRVTGDRSWVLKMSQSAERLLEYEAGLNDCLRELQCTVLCQFDRRLFDSATLLGILAAHPLVFSDSMVHRNPGFLSAHDRERGDGTARYVEQWMRALSRHGRATENLAQERRLNQILIDEFPCVVGILDSRTHRVLAQNAAAREAGLRLGEPCYESRGLTAPCVWCKAQAACETSAAQRAEVEEGDQCWDMRWTPLGDGMVLVSSWDITHRKAMENELREAQARYRAVLDALQEGVAGTDGSDRITFVNRRAVDVLGYAAEELVGRHPADIATEEGRARIEQTLAASRHGVMAQGDMEFERKDGTRVLVKVNAAPMQDEQGRFAGTIATLVDVTERRKLELAARQAEKMATLGRVAAGMMHEINAPNTFVATNLPVLRVYWEAARVWLESYAHSHPDARLAGLDFDQFQEDTYRLIDDMQHGSDRIADIVAHLRDYVRLRETRKALARIEDLIQGGMKLVYKEVRKRVSRLEVCIASDLPMVCVDADRIEQVVMNLVINASHAVDKRDSFVRVTACLSAGGEAVEVRVEDNGTGIRKEHLPSIFEPFFTTKMDRPGMGIGLAICKRTAEEHGGTISASSVLGEGSCFVLTIPLPKGDADAENPGRG